MAIKRGLVCLEAICESEFGGVVGELPWEPSASFPFISLQPVAPGNPNKGRDLGKGTDARLLASVRFVFATWSERRGLKFPERYSNWLTYVYIWLSRLLRILRVNVGKPSQG